jgi:integrase
MGRDGSGVTVRGDTIVLSFTHEGRRCRETLRLNGKAMHATPSNLKYALRLRADIDRQQAHGAFDYVATFPESRRLVVPAPSSRTFGAVADAWLKSMGQRSDATRNQYGNAIELWKKLLGKSTPIGELGYQAIASVVGSHPWASAKSANNYLIPLRGVFAFEYAGPRAPLNPMVGIRNLKAVKKLPDPLTAAERDAILAEMDARYDPRVVAYFRFAFFTGVRPEELIALRWEDVDESAGIVRLQRVRTFRGAERDGSKTHAERDIELVPEALAALEVMKPFTAMKRDEAAQPVDIFENPVTGRPWHDERSQRDHYWKPTLKHLKIRTRRCYATRHTFATVALMGGVNPAYIAAQLGHATPKTTFDKYARWIHGADAGAARARLAEALGGKQWRKNGADDAA